ncbi:MAG: hypothetical protein P4L40_14585 [Terracidiphilus sp.]|nr:hypothetical protein [Terracidiphilus sp.]
MAWQHVSCEDVFECVYAESVSRPRARMFVCVCVCVCVCVWCVCACVFQRILSASGLGAARLLPRLP